VWSQNAWDHVPPPDDQIETITASLARQRIAPVPDNEKPRYNENPSRHWWAGRVFFHSTSSDNAI
jgi:tRNAThr (cytosine32-N3)-methyltransferase